MASSSPLVFLNDLREPLGNPPVTPGHPQEDPMRVTDNGVPVQDLVEFVKQAIKAANVSRSSPDSDLRIGSVRLLLHAIATRSYGGGPNFHIPLIGTEVKLRGNIKRQDAHEIEIGLVLPAQAVRPELRGGDIVPVGEYLHRLPARLCPAFHDTGNRN